MKLKDAHWKKSYDKPRQCVKKQRHHFADKGLYSQICSFFSSQLRMWELDHKEGWAPKNWCFHIVVLEKTPESLLDCKGFKPVKPKGNQPWIFIGRTDAEAEAPILWPKAGEGNNRGWGGWMASLTQWSWVWTNSGRWWKTGKPGMLQSMGSQRVGHNLVTEQLYIVTTPQWTN